MSVSQMREAELLSALSKYSPEKRFQFTCGSHHHCFAITVPVQSHKFTPG